MATVHQEGALLRVETNCYQTTVATEGYVSGVMAGSFVDKATSSHDLGFGSMIIDFLLEPGADDPSAPEGLRYEWNNAYHGSIPKRYVELPQICTQARKLPFEVVEGDDFVAVRQWFQWTAARPPYRPGSQWEQWLVFPDGVRWFAAYDRVTSANTLESVFLRMDMPGHLKHQRGDNFRQIYLSYQGAISSEAFIEDFPPDARNLYQRDDAALPQRLIRGYQYPNGHWLAGIALDPSAVYEAWCHQRSYICFIAEIGGRPVRAGESFGAVHLVGYFDTIEEMERVADAHHGVTSLHVEGTRWSFQS